MDWQNGTGSFGTPVTYENNTRAISSSAPLVLITMQEQVVDFQSNPTQECSGDFSPRRSNFVSFLHKLRAILISNFIAEFIIEAFFAATQVTPASGQ